MRQIILDTETTGLSAADGHRIIEIGCLELINRKVTGNNFHYYINPEREIDAGAISVHGITQEFLADKPVFRDIADALIAFIKGAELVIHNAEFDISFLNHEFKRIGNHLLTIQEYCGVIDTLMLARQKHPGQRNSLDALCKRYAVDNSGRDLHGALLDARLLADVYLAMTGGQTVLFQEAAESSASSQQSTQISMPKAISADLKVLPANAQEQEAHNKFLEQIKEKSAGICVWKE